MIYSLDNSIYTLFSVTTICYVHFFNISALLKFLLPVSGTPPPLHSLLCSLLNMHPWWQSMKGVIMCVFDSFIIFYLKAFFYFTYQRKFNFPPLLMLSPTFLRLNACPLLRKGKASHEGSTKSGTLSWNRTNPQLPLPKLNKVSLHRKLVPKSHFLHK